MHISFGDYYTHLFANTFPAFVLMKFACRLKGWWMGPWQPYPGKRSLDKDWRRGKKFCLQLFRVVAYHFNICIWGEGSQRGRQLKINNPTWLFIITSHILRLAALPGTSSMSGQNRQAILWQGEQAVLTYHNRLVHLSLFLSINLIIVSLSGISNPWKHVPVCEWIRFAECCSCTHCPLDSDTILIDF